MKVTHLSLTFKLQLHLVFELLIETFFDIGTVLSLQQFNVVLVKHSGYCVM